MQNDDVKKIRKDLQFIRDRVNSLLDQLEPITLSGASPEKDNQSNSESNSQNNSVTRKEFDPLQQQHQQYQHKDQVTSPSAKKEGITITLYLSYFPWKDPLWGIFGLLS